jgi:hypothetical protein
MTIARIRHIILCDDRGMEDKKGTLLLIAHVVVIAAVIIYLVNR